MGLKKLNWRKFSETGFSKCTSEVLMYFRSYTLAENSGMASQVLTYVARIGGVNILDNFDTANQDEEIKWHSLYDGILTLYRGIPSQEHKGEISYIKRDGESPESFSLSIEIPDETFDILRTLDYSKFEVSMQIKYKTDNADNIYTIAGDLNWDVKIPEGYSDIIIKDYYIVIAKQGQRETDWYDLLGVKQEQEELGAKSNSQVITAIEKVTLTIIICCAILGMLIIIFHH